MNFNTLPNELKSILDTAQSLHSIDTFSTIMSLIDLTALSVMDTPKRIQAMCEYVNQFNTQYPQIKNVAAICVYPLYVELVKKTLTIPTVKIASVAAGFPDTQLLWERKQQEIEQVIADGANEIDLVFPVGKYKEGDLEGVQQELKNYRELCKKVQLKVILETGALSSPTEIYQVAMLTMESGADFIKTSTGKFQPAATYEAVFVMCKAIEEYYRKTGIKVGIKAAGGITTAADALNYYAIVNGILGEEWLNPNLFRIGASKLANAVVTLIKN
jgi:deoxyribose-phosphate aldolase